MNLVMLVFLFIRSLVFLFTRSLVFFFQQAKKQSDGVTAFHQLIGLQLEDVQTLGKELFMYFGKLCLRY